VRAEVGVMGHAFTIPGLKRVEVGSARALRAVFRALAEHQEGTRKLRSSPSVVERKRAGREERTAIPEAGVLPNFGFRVQFFDCSIHVKPRIGESQFWIHKLRVLARESQHRFLHDRFLRQKAPLGIIFPQAYGISRRE
jgi:hypothetical protein